MEIEFILGKEKVDALYAMTKKSKGGRKSSKKASDKVEAKTSGTKEVALRDKKIVVCEHPVELLPQKPKTRKRKAKESVEAK